MIGDFGQKWFSFHFIRRINTFGNQWSWCKLQNKDNLVKINDCKFTNKKYVFRFFTHHDCSKTNNSFTFV